MDIFSAVTDRIIAALEKGTVPWKQPWSGSCGCISYATGKPYSLLNHLLLGGKAGEYVTFKQCTQAGGYVRRGEKAHLVVFWKPWEEVDQDTGEITTHFLLRYLNLLRNSRRNEMYISYIWESAGVKPKGCSLLRMVGKCMLTPHTAG